MTRHEVHSIINTHSAECRSIKTEKTERSSRHWSSGVATHWILCINPGAARCWRAAKCDNVLNEQRQSH